MPIPGVFNNSNPLNAELNPICYLLALLAHHFLHVSRMRVNPLNAELNPICHLLTLLGAHPVLHISRIKVKSLTLRLLMSYIYIYTHTYMEHLFLMFLDHTQRRSTARLLRSWVRIPPGAWIFVCCECCVLSRRGLCDELITCPEES